MSEYELPKIGATAKALIGVELFGEPLRTYAPMRYTIAQAMGMLWPYLGDGGVAQMQATGMYAGLPKDMAILLWVLRLKEPSEQSRDEVKARQWNTMRALASPREAVMEAVAWAGGIGILDVGTEKFEEASGVFFDLVKPVEEAKFSANNAEPETEDDQSPKV